MLVTMMPVGSIHRYENNPRKNAEAVAKVRRAIGRWMQKAYEEAAEHGALVVVLVPARTDVRWFHRWVLPYAEVRFLQGRLGFRRDGAAAPRAARAPFASMVCVFRPGCGAADRVARPQLLFPFLPKAL